MTAVDDDGDWSVWESRTPEEREARRRAAYRRLVAEYAAAAAHTTRSRRGRPQSVDTRARIARGLMEHARRTLPASASAVKRERLRQGLTRRQLCARADVSPSSLWRIEAGQSTKWKTRLRVAEALGKPPRVLGIGVAP